MYLQITTRCNMACEHCGFDCGPKGYDMPLRTFKQACKLGQEYGSSLFIGGGEPTLHPRFWQILMLSLDYSEEKVGIITNGKRTQDALILLELIKKDVVWGRLSYDQWHEPIDPKVVEAYKKAKAINDVNWNISLVGRAKRNELDSDSDGTCLCEDLVVDPAGNIWACGCCEVMYGNVWYPKIPERHWNSYTCCSRPYEEEEE